VIGFWIKFLFPFGFGFLDLVCFVGFGFHGFIRVISDESVGPESNK
jgi:hypothetical protein